jgi:sulfur relay (sulfurtransferase) complex TusBCD TusD component (DsrE family)
MKAMKSTISVLVTGFALYGAVGFGAQFFGSDAPAAASEVAYVAGAMYAEEPPAPEELVDGLFVNLSTDDMDTAAMAIGFSTKVIKNTGKPATIFLNVRGARLADINIPQSVHKSGSTVQEMLQVFMDEGGTVLLCPVCMKNVAGLAEDEVLPGVIIGKPEYVYGALFAENATVLSY